MMKTTKMLVAIWAMAVTTAFGETLQEKIDAAADGATITWSGMSGPIVVRGKSLTITGSDFTAVIDGGGTARCAYLGEEGSTAVTLKGFTLKNGKADWGAGVYGGKLVDCTISGCTATLAGGAYGATLENCTVSGNAATEAGAALGNCTATGCTITGNRRTASESAVAVHGGLVYGSTLTDCQVTGNTLGFGADAPVKGAIGYQVTMTRGKLASNAVSVNREIVYGEKLNGDFAESTLTDVEGGDDPGPGPGPGPGPEPEPEPPVPPEWQADTAYLNLYHRAVLADLKVTVPTDRKITIKAEGLPKGMKLVTKALKDDRNKPTGFYEYAIEGVPTELMDGLTRVAYVRVTDKKVQTLHRLVFRVLPAEDYERIAFPDARLGQDYTPAKVTWYWPAVSNAPSAWTFSGWPSGIKYDKKTFTVSGTPKKAGRFTVKATEKVAGTSYKSVHMATFTVWPDASGAASEWTDKAYVGINRKSEVRDVKSASGLPTGIKFTAKEIVSRGVLQQEAQTFYGTPTKAGTYAVTLTHEGNAKSQFLWTITPADAPAFELKLTETAVDPQAVKATIRQGVAYEWAVTNTLGSKVSASGLPTGLKLVSTAVKDGTKTIGYTYVVKGVPTKAGEFYSVFKTTMNGVTTTTSAAFTVEALPAWAQGTFNGGSEIGQVSFTVSKTGKVSGKYLETGLTWTLTAASYDRYDEELSKYVAVVVGKRGSGKSVVAFTNELTVTCDEVGGFATNEFFVAYQNNWKTEPWKTIAKAFPEGGEIVLHPGIVGTNDTVSLKFASSGKVTVKAKIEKSVSASGKVSYYSASGSAVLCPLTVSDVMTGAFDGVVFVYLPPKAKTPLASGYSVCVPVQWSGLQFALGEDDE